MSTAFDRPSTSSTPTAPSASISTIRLELQIEGTDAAVPNASRHLAPYDLPCKPGPVDRRPC